MLENIHGHMRCVKSRWAYDQIASKLGYANSDEFGYHYAILTVVATVILAFCEAKNNPLSIFYIAKEKLTAP